MDTNCKAAMKDSSHSSAENTNKQAILANYLPAISVLNVSIIYPFPNVESSILRVQENSISFPSLNDLTITFEGIDFESETPMMKPVSVTRSTLFNYRLITKPPKSSSGSSVNEFIAKSADTHEEDEGLTKMRKYFLSSPQPVVQENVQLSVSCRSCSNILGTNITFKKVRALPSGNWDEKANDLWFCHPPGGCGSGGHTHESNVETLTDSVKGTHISDDSPSPKSIFDMIANPDPQTCLYNPCDWAVNRNLIQGKFEVCNVSGVDVIVCTNCKSELGSVFSEKCVSLWDFGVVWLKEDEEIQLKEKSSCTDKAVENFKRSLFAHISELSFSPPPCQFIIKSSSNPKSQAFLWNTDRNMLVYHSYFQTHLSSELKISPVKVAKFMFLQTSSNGNFETSNPYEESLISDVEKDDSVHLFIPDAVYEAGMNYLNEKSNFYAFSSGFRCGFLPY
jgi:hypothetical protein